MPHVIIEPEAIFLKIIFDFSDGVSKENIKSPKLKNKIPKNKSKKP